MATLPKPPLSSEVSVEQYLATSFDGPDAEYVDGTIVERPMPSRPHAHVQKVLVKVLGAHESSHNVDAYPELRLRLGPAKFLVPDVCVFRTPVEDDVPSTPPMLVAEIVSPSDVYSNLMMKLAEYSAWGVEHVWLINPDLRSLAVYRDGSVLHVEALALSEFGVRLTAEDLFDR